MCIYEMVYIKIHSEKQSFGPFQVIKFLFLFPFMLMNLGVREKNPQKKPFFFGAINKLATNFPC
jgi:hypothetical protein